MASIDPWRQQQQYGAAPIPVIAQVSPTLYNPYAVAPIQPLPTQRSVAGSVSPVPVAPADYGKAYDVEAPPTTRTGPGSPRYEQPAAPASRQSMGAVYLALALIAVVTIPTLGLASYAVDRLNRTFLPGMGGAAGSAGDLTSVARENYKIWNDALQTKDYMKVAELYTGTGNDKLSFLPTVSGLFIQDNNGAQDYFVEFVKKLPFGTVTDDQVQTFAADSYLHSGMYTFMLGDESKGDKRSAVDARFSYVWKNIGGKWKITHHHSSVRPPLPK